jgi:hypothetical protein
MARIECSYHRGEADVFVATDGERIREASNLASGGRAEAITEALVMGTGRDMTGADTKVKPRSQTIRGSDAHGSFKATGFAFGAAAKGGNGGSDDIGQQTGVSSSCSAHKAVYSRRSRAAHLRPPDATGPDPVKTGGQTGTKRFVGLSVAGAAADVLAAELDSAEETRGVGTSGRVAKAAIRTAERSARTVQASAHTRRGHTGTLNQGASGKATKDVSPAARSRAVHRMRLQATSRRIQAARRAQATQHTHAALQANGKKGVLVALAKGAASALAPVAAGILLFVVGAVVVVALFNSLIGGVIGAGNEQRHAAQSAGMGLPAWITADMVEAVLYCQETFGDPAGANLAQMIVESGSGNVPSSLATEQHNFYGMKWVSSFAGEPEVRGYKIYSTSEQADDGSIYQVSARFIDLKTARDGIVFRSRVFLASSNYSQNPLIIQAKQEKNSDLMAEGLKDAGWATSQVYVQSLRNAMDTYDLRAFDSMSVEQWQAYRASMGPGNAAQQAVAAEARSHPKMAHGHAGADLCLAFVNCVYTHAGFETSAMYQPGARQARDLLAVHHGDWENIPIGAVVFSGDEYRGGVIGGINYGHVGIYVGSGEVIDQIGTTSLSAWVSHYRSDSAGGGWAWAGGVDLSEIDDG